MDPVDFEQKVRQLEDLMARLQRLMHIRHTPHRFGLTTSQVFILRFLDKVGCAKASDIARVAGLSPGAVTQVCDELVRLRLVQRKRSADDRRVVNVSLTEEGRQRLEHIRSVQVRRLMEVLYQLGPDDTEAFLRIMRRLVETVESLPPAEE
ncbi:MarR family winged helix-turn-helix transcriptional regulator [Alicyclobacillus cellulosilyticus]|uniref:MarR family winged helix-turn-helix transcriptional regulator n=1 Tax=Alicyclobacillus cellulosilyticus TaxID=1003997 RepID=UPI00166912D7|nr:MarR family transcriptional regulator [Alicyclobacillus cellulosilyticus]